MVLLSRGLLCDATIHVFYRLSAIVCLKMLEDEADLV